jgi:hypothetical protein
MIAALKAKGMEASAAPPAAARAPKAPLADATNTTAAAGVDPVLRARTAAHFGSFTAKELKVALRVRHATRAATPPLAAAKSCACVARHVPRATYRVDPPYCFAPAVCFDLNNITTRLRLVGCSTAPS